MLPSERNGGQKGMWTTQNIATAMTIYKSVLGPAAGAVASTEEGRIREHLLKELESKLKSIEQSVKAGGVGTKGGERQY